MYQIQAYPPLFDGRRYRIERDPIVFDRDMQFSLNGTDMNIKIMVRHSFATMIDNIQHDFLKAKVTAVKAGHGINTAAALKLRTTK